MSTEIKEKKKLFETIIHQNTFAQCTVLKS